jgi:hypothetical protein
LPQLYYKVAKIVVVTMEQTKLRVPILYGFIASALFMRCFEEGAALYDAVIPRNAQNVPQSRFENNVTMTEQECWDVAVASSFSTLLAQVKLLVDRNQIYLAKVAVMTSRQELQSFWPGDQRTLRSVTIAALLALHRCGNKTVHGVVYPLGTGQFARVFNACLSVIRGPGGWAFRQPLDAADGYVQTVLFSDSGNFQSQQFSRNIMSYVPLCSPSSDHRM